MTHDCNDEHTATVLYNMVCFHSNLINKRHFFFSEFLLRSQVPLTRMTHPDLLNGLATPCFLVCVFLMSAKVRR